jgi:hypothetical protein
MTEDRPVIVFDSLCVLCSANARFIIEHDRAARFRLAAMQSEIGAALYRRFGPVSSPGFPGDAQVDRAPHGPALSGGQGGPRMDQPKAGGGETYEKGDPSTALRAVPLPRKSGGG